MKAPAARFSVPLERPPGPLALVSWPLQLLTLAIFLGSAAAFAVLERRMPARVPVHYGLRGEVDRWGSPSELWAVALLPTLMLLLPWFIACAVAKERWALPTDAPESYKELELRRRRLLVHLGEHLGFVLVIGSCGFWLTIGWPGWGFSAAMAFILISSGPLLIAVLTWNLMALGRVDRQRRALAGSSALGTHPGGWRLGGLIYFAREDPAVFVPRLIGIGSTVNFARPSVWLLSAVLIIAQTLIIRQLLP